MITDDEVLEWLSDQKKEQLIERCPEMAKSYYQMWKSERDKNNGLQDQLKKMTKRNKIMGRYLMAHSRRLRATREQDGITEADAVVNMLRGTYDEYKFTEVHPVRWVTQDNVDRNPEYYKVLKKVQAADDEGIIQQWCLIMSAKEYPRPPLGTEEKVSETV